MRILYLVTNFNLIGGKEQYDKNFIRLLANQAVVRVVMLKSTNLFQKIEFIIQTIFQCFARQWDFIFCAHISFAPICLFLQYAYGIKYVIIVHGMEIWNIKKFLQKSTLRHATIIITVSNFTKEKIIEQLPEVKERIQILPNSIDGTLFSIGEKSPSLISKYQLNNSRIILTVSHLYPTEREKGHYRVIDALQIIKKTIPSVKYIIVGSGLKEFGDAREDIKIYAQKKKVYEHIILPGKVSHEELVQYYNLCDVFVMPSKQEGFGIVFLEALACGRPVIVGNKDASYEAILNGELGLLVDPDNTEEIAQAIMQILQHNASERFFDREFLRNRVLEEYGIDILKKKVGEFTKSISY